jgi:hypothetical protein
MTAPVPLAVSAATQTEPPPSAQHKVSHLSDACINHEGCLAASVCSSRTCTRKPQEVVVICGHANKRGTKISKFRLWSPTTTASASVATGMTHMQHELERLRLCWFLGDAALSQQPSRPGAAQSRKALVPSVVSGATCCRWTQCPASQQHSPL